MKKQNLDDLLNDIVKDIPTLTGETVIGSPDSPWNANPKFIKKLKQFHELLDGVKNGAEFIIISSTDGGESVNFYTANMTRAKTIERLSRAITKLSKKLDEDKPSSC